MTDDRSPADPHDAVDPTTPTGAPGPDPAAAPATFAAGPDPSDVTMRHEVPSAEPVESLGADRYSPAPETRPEWARTYDTPPPTTPERWFEPAAAAPAVVAVSGRRSGTGTVLAAALLSAVLASGGTVLALGATGALDRPSPITSVPTGTTTTGSRPVTIDESSATIDVAAKVSPAVVRITVTGSAGIGDLGVIPSSGVGSGVIYDSNGWILTNRHVVEGGDTFDVELKDGRILSGKVYGVDTLTDLAIIKVEATDLPVAAIGESDSLKVGQLVIAIGSPLGTYSNSVTSGIVSATGRSIVTEGSTRPLNNLIQTDAAINPGNSGGPLLDADANVIGINTAVATGSNGIGFAIPIDIARPIMEQAVAGETLARPYLGISYVSITRQYAEANDLPVTQGAHIGGDAGEGGATQGIVAGTPAAAAGLKDGDIVQQIDDKVIDEEHPLDATLSQFSPGDTVAVKILRDGETLTLDVTLGTRPPDL